MNIFEIPEENMDALRDKIAKLNRRGHKLGQSVPQLVEYAVIDKPLVKRKRLPNDSYNTYEEPQVIEPQQFDETKHEQVGYRRYFVMELIGEAPVIDGWELLGVVEHTGNSEIGNIIRDVPGKEVPIEYRNSDSNCEHCNTKRRRLETFILFNTETQTHQQIGRNCLADFCRSPDFANQLCEYAEYVNRLAGLCASAEDEEGYSGGRKIERAGTLSVLSFTARLVRLSGWLSRSKARELSERGESKTPTANIVESAIFEESFWKVTDRTSYSHVEWLSKLKEIEEKDTQLAQDALDWIRAKLPEKNNLKDYLYNLLVVASEETVIKKHFGILCSLISTYQREMGLVEERKNSPQSNFVGEVGKRETFECTLVNSSPFDSDFGTKYLCVFDHNGNRLFWWSSTDAITNYKTGDKLSVTGTVKKHSEYKGIKQTELSRCKLKAIV